MKLRIRTKINENLDDNQRRENTDIPKNLFQWVVLIFFFPLLPSCNQMLRTILYYISPLVWWPAALRPVAGSPGETTSGDRTNAISMTVSELRTSYPVRPPWCRLVNCPSPDKFCCSIGIMQEPNYLAKLFIFLTSHYLLLRLNTSLLFYFIIYIGLNIAN